MAETDALDRVAKMLERAEHLEKAAGDGPIPPEAALCREKAAEFAERYSIDIAAARLRNKRVPEGAVSKQWTVGRPFRQQEGLVYVIYSSYGCKLLHIGSGRESRGNVYAFGFPDDMKLAGVLYASVLSQAQREVVRAYREYTGSFKPWECSECGGGDYRPIPMDEDYYYCTSCRTEFYSRSAPSVSIERRSTWYRSFWSEFVLVVGGRIEKQRSKTTRWMTTTSEGQGAELAVRSRDEELDVLFKKQFSNVREGRRSRAPSGSGSAAGREAGMRADLGGGKLTGGKQRSLEK